MTRHTERRTKKITVSEAAKILGVTREHLSRVLHGHRVSRSLTLRFRALLAANSR